MNSELLLIATALTTFTMVWTANRMGLSFLRSLLYLFLFLVAVLGGKLMHVFGITTNVVETYYVGVMMVMAIAYQNFGRDKALHTLNSGFFVMVCCFILVHLLNAYPDLDFQRELSEAIQLVSHTSANLAIGSFLAFYVANSVFIKFAQVKGIETGWKYFKYSSISQFIDSFIFFPIAFSAIMAPSQLITTAFWGWISKTVITVISIPFYLCATKKPSQ